MKPPHLINYIEKIGILKCAFSKKPVLIFTQGLVLTVTTDKSKNNCVFCINIPPTRLKDD